MGSCSVLEGNFWMQPPLQCGWLPHLEALLAIWRTERSHLTCQ